MLDVASFTEAERLYMLVRDTAVHGRPLTALVLPDVLVSGCRQGHSSRQGRSPRSGGDRPAPRLTGGGPRATGTWPHSPCLGGLGHLWPGGGAP